MLDQFGHTVKAHKKPPTTQTAMPQAAPSEAGVKFVGTGSEALKAKVASAPPQTSAMLGGPNPR
jgi:hypothetical protein